MGVRLMNMIVSATCVIVAFCAIKGFLAGQVDLSSTVFTLVAAYGVRKLFKNPRAQSMLCRFMKWDPVGNCIEESKKFGRKYDAYVAQQREQARRNAAAAAEYSRRRAADAAVFHETQAKRYAGTYDGYRHQNMANRYRNEARG